MVVHDALSRTGSRQLVGVRERRHDIGHDAGTDERRQAYPGPLCGPHHRVERLWAGQAGDDDGRRAGERRHVGRIGFLSSVASIVAGITSRFDIL